LALKHRKKVKNSPNSQNDLVKIPYSMQLMVSVTIQENKIYLA